MASGWIITVLGVIAGLLGWYLTPYDWGYGILGFGFAFVILGVLDLFRSPIRVR